MARTQIGTTLIEDGSVRRADINTALSGSALITKVIVNSPLTISSTGADSGTGDVTLGLSTANLVTSFNTRVGAVTLSGSDVITALGYTPISGESDTLATVTGRGATTSTLVTLSGGVNSGILGYGISSIPSNTTFINDTSRVVQSPATWIWHDILAFNRLTGSYETYNGTTWSSATLNTELFAQKQNQSIAIIDNSTVFGARWTFTNGATAWSSAEWMVLGITWSPSQATVNVLLESWDGTTWNTRHNSNTTVSATNYFGYISPYNGDSQLRLTITRTGGGNLFNLSNIRFLSARPGDQGAGMEEQMPIYWDGNRNVAVGTGASSNTKLVVGGSIGAVTNYAAGLAVRSTLTAVANNDLLVGLDVNPTLSVGSYTGLGVIGIRSTINTGSNYWNLYINGTANNYLNGKLLIGTTTDSGYKLDVNGTLRATSVSVTGGTSSQFLKADGTVDSSTYLKLIDSFDTRAVASTPQSYDKQIRFDFKQNSTNGLSDGGTYNGVLYWRKYGATTDWSGGGAFEIAYTDNGNLWHRYGSSTTWNAWRRVWNDNDFTSTSITNWNTAYTNRITSLTTTGSSGAATLSANTLNIPNYTLAGLGGQPLATNLTSLAGLTYASTSFVKMTAAGTFSLDTNTYYLASNPSGYTNNTGTVTSVSMTVPTGLNISGSPITTSGTLALTFTAGYSIPTTASQTNWDTAYTNRIDTVTTLGTSGAATLLSNSLNIPDYSVNFTNNTSGNIMTGSGATNTLNGQTELTYVGNVLTLGPNLDNNTTYTITTRNQMIISANTDATNDAFFTFLTLQSGAGSNISAVAIVGSSTNNYINFRTLATDRMRVFSTGNVLIQSGGTFTDAGFKLDVSGTTRLQNQVTVNGSITAATAIARGGYFNNTLVAAANNDVLVAVDIAPTFTLGAFTGVNSVALRLSGGVLRVAQLAADPAVANSANGDIYYNTTTNKFRGRENGVWVNFV